MRRSDKVDLNIVMRWRKAGGQRLVLTKDRRLLFAEIRGGYKVIRQSIGGKEAVAYAKEDGWEAVAHGNGEEKRIKVPRSVAGKRPLKRGSQTPESYRPILEEKISFHQERVEREMANLKRSPGGRLA